ncbi:MAG: hypothetical protein AAF211_02965 [Myxococcota bacterium]
MSWWAASAFAAGPLCVLGRVSKMAADAIAGLPGAPGSLRLGG